MSGLIGQVGSKSGIVGSTTDSTQLDYEQGFWTITGSYIDSASVGVYVKIGSMVFIQAWIKASGGDTTTSFGNLPFTADSSVGNAQGGGNTAFQNRNTVGQMQMGFLVSGNSFTMYQGRNAVNLGNGEQMHLQLSYRAT